jgi:TPP-dependent pyruvate/acetoin dehydrogenase alpha subunit
MKGKVSTMPETSQSVAETDERESLASGYQTMVGIRRFEERIQSLFLRGEVPGTVHLYNGQEAVATGVCSMLDGDQVSATYRGHGPPEPTAAAPAL